MVKGVNKTVIEVNDTGSKVFDRIIFYVTPQYSNLTARQLKRATESFTFQFDKRSGRGYEALRKRMMRRRRLTFIGLIASALAVLATVLLIVL